MRKVVRNYRTKPSILRGNVALMQWNQIAVTKDTSLIQTKIYRDPYKNPEGDGSRVLDKLGEWYLGKCAYCERYYKLDVEHYRPKGRITDLENKEISATGYYWLCYEWSNLLPSCISCNREGGKSDKFPILGPRVTNPSFRTGNLVKTRCLVSCNHFMQEIPCLLNPEMDGPEDYFAFEIVSTGLGIKMIGIDTQGRGNATIAMCKLNRPEIKVERQKVVQEFSSGIASLFSLYQARKRSRAELKQGVELLLQKLYDDTQNPTLTHTYLRSYIIQNEANFKRLVLPYLVVNMQNIVLEAFKNYVPI